MVAPSRQACVDRTLACRAITTYSRAHNPSATQMGRTGADEFIALTPLAINMVHYPTHPATQSQHQSKKRSCAKRSRMAVQYQGLRQGVHVLGSAYLSLRLCRLVEPAHGKTGKDSPRSLSRSQADSRNGGRYAPAAARYHRKFVSRRPGQGIEEFHQLPSCAALRWRVCPGLAKINQCCSYRPSGRSPDQIDGRLQLVLPISGISK